MLNLPPATIISRLLTLVIAFTVHEFSHAKVADLFGDTTPRMNGRLTLNPIAHLDIFGSLLLLVSGFGWAKPVPINPYALSRRSPAGVMWVSLAGPMSNFLMAIFGAVPLRMHLFTGVPSPVSGLLPSPNDFLIEFVIINLVLMLFNLIPLAPLDGDKIAEYFFPPNISHVFESIRPYGPVILIAILFVGPLVGIDLLGKVMYPVINRLFYLLIGVPA